MRATAKRSGGWRRAAAGLTLAFCLLLPMSAAATAEPIVKGKTQVRLTRALMAALRADGVRLAKLGRAKVNGRVASLPIGGGEADLASASGSVEHEGGFALVAGRRAVKISSLRLDTGKRGLWGKIDGRAMRIAGFATYTAERAGFGDAVAAPALKLRPAVAALLDRRLGLTGLFPTRLPFASLTSHFRPQFDTVASGSLELRLDAITLAKLEAAGIRPTPFEAKVLATDPPAYAASLTGGAIYPDLRGGTAVAEAGLRLTREAPWAQVSWTGVSLSLESNKLFAESSLAKGSGSSPKGSGPVAALDLSGATARVDPDRRAVAITGIRLTLEAPAAALVNEAFAKAPGQQVVAAGELLGTVSLWMTGR